MIYVFLRKPNRVIGRSGYQDVGKYPEVTCLH